MLNFIRRTHEKHILHSVVTGSSTVICEKSQHMTYFRLFLSLIFLVKSMYDWLYWFISYCYIHKVNKSFWL